ncbi:hypothetical protein M9Y10_035893 [Tritrichomonas musculus]|uniref:AIG1-type G domain-containing protein n=1 Tax=Tritrichomonas musculus TaxID=1915356 RepID=A0ABR2GXH1_9EUKA
MSDITVIPIGGTGIGKSTLGCTFIENKNAFKASSSTDSCTVVTEVKSNIIDGIKVNYIDNPGFVTTDIKKDQEYIEKMVSFLKSWSQGINAFFIVVNSQKPRFEDSDKKILKYLYYFFNNNTELWNQTAIVFTKCFDGTFDSEKEKEDFVNNYKDKIIKTIKMLKGCENLQLQMQCFCVNSKLYDDQNTKKEFNKIRDFAKQFKPISTNNLRPFNTEYLMRNETIIQKTLCHTEIKQIDKNKKSTIFYYKDSKKIEIIDWNDKFTQTEEVVKEWTETITEEHEFLFNQLVNTKCEESGNITKTIMHYQDQEKVKITDNQGNSKYEPIKVIKEWTETITKEREILLNQLANTKCEKSGNITKKIMLYQDQERIKITDNQGKSKYDPIKVIKEWTEIIIEELESLLNQLVNTKYEESGKITKKIMCYQNQERVKITDNQGKIKYNPIKVIKEWTETITIEREYLDNQLVDTKCEESGNIKKRTMRYQNQERVKITDNQGKSRYDPIKVIKEWTETIIEERESFKNQLVNTIYEGSGKSAKKIMIYQDQERVKIIDNQGKIQYSPTKVNNEWKVEKKATVDYEFDIKQVGEPSTECHYKRVMKKDAVALRTVIGIFSGGFSEFFGDAWKTRVLDYKIVTTEFQKVKREIITSPDGEKSYGNWFEIEKFKKMERIDG